MILYHDDVYFFINDGAILKNFDHSVDPAEQNYEQKGTFHIILIF